MINTSSCISNRQQLASGREKAGRNCASESQAEKVPGVVRARKQIFKIFTMPKIESTGLVVEGRLQSCQDIESCRNTKLGSQRTPRDEVVHDIRFWCQHITMIMLHRLCYAEPTVSRQRNLGHEAEMIKAATKV